MRQLSPWAWIVIAALAAAAAGCGEVVANPDASGDGPPGGDVDDGARSGTRLKLKWIDFGGTRVARGEIDTMRDEDCSPYEWADGKFYCTPNATSVVFSDAACTQRLGLQYVGGTCPSPAPEYLLEYMPSTCNSFPTRLYERGAQSAATAHYELASDGTCAGPYADPNYRYYAAGAVVPTSALIEMTRSAPTSGSRYSQGFYESTDGARVFSQVHDSVLDTNCYLNTQAYDSPTGTCGPSDAWYSGYFQDPSCSQRKIDVPDSCETPRFGVSYPQTVTCPGEYAATYYMVGAVADTTLFADDGAGTCTAQTAQPSRDYYALGPPLTLPGVPRSRDTTAGRRIQMTHYHDGAASIRDYVLFDQELDVNCYPYIGSDGTPQCMPFNNSVSEYFSDPACVNPLDVIEAYRGDLSCAEPPAPKYAVKYIPPTSGCLYTYEVHRAGAQLGSAVYTNGSGVCEIYNPATVVMYASGAVVPPAQLATGVLVTDP